MSKIKSTVVGLMAALAAVVGAPAVAGAQEASDPTDGAGTQILNDATSWVTSQGVPLIVGLLVIGIIVSLLVKFARRGARSA